MNKRKLTFTVFIGLILLFLTGVGMIYSDYRTRSKAKQEYESLAQIVKEARQEEETKEIKETKEESSAPYVSPIPFDQLEQINPDIVGWLKIEDTAIDYPIVQTDNNETYLETDFTQKKNKVGAIYLDYQCESDFSGRHNILYGHNRKDGTMFQDIIQYKDETFFKNHQNIIVYTKNREYHLRPITVLYADASGIRRQTRFDTMESFYAYTKEMTKGGMFLKESDLPVETLWSFITCSYEFEDARTILYAALVP
ncbi:class B sortase [Clostridium sp. E02]|uniref:class B sortase n=1 Tax=Clostridium sp. E02 TaxID=2487134 RepID=UPI000F53BAA9|nr:class B sortase [Clostridium sp. E02]